MKYKPHGSFKPIFAPLAPIFRVNGVWCAFFAVLCLPCLTGNLPHCPASTTNDPEAPVAKMELSVAPSSYVEFPELRPAWVDAPADLAGEIHRWPVTSTPCRSAALSEEGLKVSLRAAVETYIETVLQVEDSSQYVSFDDEWINRHRDRTKDYLGTVHSGDELMYEAATVLVFDKDDRKHIEQHWRRHEVGQRLAVLGILSGGTVTAFIGVSALLCLVTRRAERRVEA